MQCGVPISGALFTPSQDGERVDKSVEDSFAPLPTLALPFLPYGSEIDWQNSVKSIPKLLDGVRVSALPAPVAIDVGAGTVKLFLPGFDKREVKLSQVRLSSLVCMFACLHAGRIECMQGYACMYVRGVLVLVRVCMHV